MANVEMKTLTIGDNTYEIVDETARNGVEALETNKDMSSYSTLLEYVLANPFSRAYYKGYGLEDCILGNAWGTIITLSPQSGAGVLVFAFRNNDTHVYMRKTHYYNSVEEWNGDWLDITKMSERIDKISADGFVKNANEANTIVALATGWATDNVNFPSEFKNAFGELITTWEKSANVGSITATRKQVLIWENYIAQRHYTSSGWSDWNVHSDSWKTLSATDVFSDIIDYTSAEVKQLGKRIYAHIVFKGSITTTGANYVYVATVNSAYKPMIYQIYGTRINASNVSGQSFVPAAYNVSPTDNKIYVIPPSVQTYGNDSYPWSGSNGITFIWDIA